MVRPPGLTGRNPGRGPPVWNRGKRSDAARYYLLHSVVRDTRIGTRANLDLGLKLPCDLFDSFSALPPVEGHNLNRRTYAALLVDLDGTLIATDTLTPGVAAAVKRVSEFIPVSIATGRRSSDVIDYARRLGLTAPQISNGGATLLDPTTGNTLWSSALPEGRAREIVRQVCAEQINFIATHPSGDATALADITHWDLTRISAMDLLEFRADELMAQFSGAPDLYVVKVYLHYNGLWAVDFTGAGVNKGSAARKLAQIMAVESDRFIVAGDSFNDLPMLEVAGLRIVMASAPPELRAIADYVAPAVEEDGLAVAIDELILPALLAG